MAAFNTADHWEFPDNHRSLAQALQVSNPNHMAVAMAETLAGG